LFCYIDRVIYLFFIFLQRTTSEKPTSKKAKPSSSKVKKSSEIVEDDVDDE